ncbi:MAG TPA: C-terminal helicase domain-containing protein, partial [Polyangiaceae bacterium]
HADNVTESVEEAEIVKAQILELMGKKWTSVYGKTQTLTAGDFMVVAPFNDQVDLLRVTLDGDERSAGVPVGTVDKFQGAEAPIVIYSMTSSSAEDAPRGLEFLYSLNRLNVATSRAQALVILVGNPELTRVRCKTPRQMQLVNALCAYLEMATRPNSDSAGAR